MVDIIGATLRKETALAEATAGVGFLRAVGPGGQSLKMRAPVISFEDLGGVGDGDEIANTGTDNAAAFARARTYGLLGYIIKFSSGKKYRTTAEIIAHSVMNWFGDNGYSPLIFGDFATSGMRIMKSPTSGPQLQKISIFGITFKRCGTNPEHGLLLDNIDGLYLDVIVEGVPGNLGGAIGVSAFYPENRPSKNCYVKAKVSYGGNFGIQYGNVEDGVIDLDRATFSHREVIGVEPYTLGKLDFATADVPSDTFTWTAHGMTTGYPLMYSREGNTAITGLGRANYYFAIPTDANHIKIANTEEDAIAGTSLPIAAFTGTHRLYKCGIAKNIVIRTANIDTGDVTSGGSGTGSIIVSATSGGYHKGVTITNPNVVERNPTSGTHNITVYGAHNISLEGGNLIGAQQCAVLFDRGFLNGVSDASGPINPTGGLQLLPDNCRAVGVSGRQFGTYGVHVRYGRVMVDECDVRSATANAVGIRLSTDAEASNSFAKNNNAECTGTGGAAFDLTRGRGNRDLSTLLLRADYITKRHQEGEFAKAFASAVGTISLATANSQARTTTTYVGRAEIIAQQTDIDNSNRAVYVLRIIKDNSAGTPKAVLLESDGLTAGSNSTHPSFTWSMVGNVLTATAVGSTNIAFNWYFTVHYTGDLYLS